MCMYIFARRDMHLYKHIQFWEESTGINTFWLEALGQSQIGGKGFNYGEIVFLISLIDHVFLIGAFGVLFHCKKFLTFLKLIGHNDRGMINIGQKRFHKALEFLHNVCKEYHSIA